MAELFLFPGAPLPDNGPPSNRGRLRIYREDSQVIIVDAQDEPRTGAQRE